MNTIVNRAYTDAIKTWLDKGYLISSARKGAEWSMGGHSQWEDKSTTLLTNGKNTIMVSVIDKHRYDNHENTRGVYTLSPITTNSSYMSISRSKILDKQIFYLIAHRYYGTKEEADKANEIHKARRERKEQAEENNRYTTFDNDKMKWAVLPFVRRFRGYKRATLENIKSIVKCYNYDDHPRYQVVVSKNGEVEWLTLGIKA